MRMIYSDHGPSPFEAGKTRLAEADSSLGLWGAFSVETFVNQSPLRYTHEDASGWLAYLQQFGDRNFWFADGDVQVWAYEETYDSWQDRYGMDSVMAVYHSGHGGMRSDGTFFAPLGGRWENRSDAVSTDMRLGNEKVNYVFWSTCESLRVLGGHSPTRTWAGPNLGFRMIFGFETVSIDHPDYGKKFWEKWRAGGANGSPLSSAWLNASWDIYDRQAPSVAACGATRDEAVNRVNNETHLASGHVSDAWWAWRWYNARSILRDPLTQLPADPRVVRLAPREPSAEIARLGQIARFPTSALAEVQVEKQGVISASSGGRQISTAPQGVRQLRLAGPNHGNVQPLDQQRAISVAQAFVDEHANGDELVLESVHDVMECCGERDKSPEEPRLVETMVTFRQVFDGIPVITPGRGQFRVSVDNDGTVTEALISTRESVTSFPQLRSAAVPPEPGRKAEPSARPPSPRAPREALDSAQRRVIDELRIRNGSGMDAGIPVRDVPDTTEIGYEIEGNEAYLAARKLIEIGAEGENSAVSRRWVVAPLAR